MLYQIDTEEKEVRKTLGYDENGCKLYGVFGKDTNNCYLLTPEKETAKQMIKPRTIGT